MPSRLSPRAALLALAVIATAGAGIAAFAATHTPTNSPTFATGHDHGSGAPAGAAPTAAERARAAELVAATEAAIAPFADMTAAEASGYRWIGDDGGEYRHYVRSAYLLDDGVLDPARIESLVYRQGEGGALELVSGMYILPPGTSVEEAPEVGGPLTPWHVHTNLCFETSGTIAGTDDDGSCPAGSFNVGTPPMLHVWVVDNPDGPFAAIDENGIVAAEH